MNTKKKNRLAVIEKILTKEKVQSQESLKARLVEAGFAVSQSSLSRYLRELGAMRFRRPDDSYAYTIPETKPAASSAAVFERRFASAVTGMRRSGFVVLVFTSPGEAQIVGILLDKLAPAGLLGNVAGDDTIICITKDARSAKALEKKLKKIIA
jgi:transcriptional regulator of arginine metabolism